MGGVAWIARRREGNPVREDPARDAASAALERGDEPGAIVEGLLRSSRSRFRRLATLIERIGRPVPGAILAKVRSHVRGAVVNNKDLTFAAALQELRNGPYADYLYQRFVNPSLLAAMPVVLLLKELRAASNRPLRVLELGGGTGHANFLMQRSFPGIQFILTDADWTNLYLAARFIAPRAAHLCLDAEARLPLPDHSIDAVYCQDSFHYMRAKAGVVQELRRVVRPGGLWLFPHLHNTLVPNPAPGMPLAPGDYARLFSFLDARFYPEADVLRSFHRDQTLDLSRRYLAEELDRAQSLTMIAGPESLWKRHDLSAMALQPAADLGINRIYAGAASGVAGPITWPSAGLREECRHVEEYLPVTPSVERGLLERLAAGRTTGEDEAVVADLVRRFVLVPMPANYG